MRLYVDVKRDVEIVKIIVIPAVQFMEPVLHQDEPRRQVNYMLIHNVIRQSVTGLKSYSQLLLTPKPN